MQILLANTQFKLEKNPLKVGYPLLQKQFWRNSKSDGIPLTGIPEFRQKVPLNLAELLRRNQIPPNFVDRINFREKML